jgi:hypothetical protein
MIFTRTIGYAMFAATLLAACTAPDAAKTMVGEWEAAAILIKIKSMHGTGGDSIVNIPDQATYTMAMNQKPIHTIYRPDGSYTAEYRNLKDSILYMNLGQWTMLNDSSLQLIQIDPKPDTAVFGVQFLKDGAQFSRRYDYDHDGAKDDLFLGVQQKIR